MGNGSKRTNFEAFCEEVLSDPIAADAFQRAQRRPLPLRLGPAYRRRWKARRR